MGDSYQKEVFSAITNQLKRDFFLIKRRPLLWRFTLFLGILALLSLLGYLFFSTNGLTDSHGRPLDFGKIEKADMTRTSFVVSSDGQIIGRFFYETRDPLKYDEIPPLLIKGFIAAEDKRFFYHPGIDVVAISRAFITNAFYKIGYGQRSGASTITQQLARLLYAKELPEFRNQEQSYYRKIKEARVAIQLDRKYPKSKIMEEFLNRIYFGHGTNGISEACRYYFGKNIVRKDELTIPEIAILASLNKSSSIYSPIFNPPPKPLLNSDENKEEVERAEKDYQKKLAKEIARINFAKKRYNYVLQKMLKYGDITEKQYTASLFKEDEPFEQNILHITPLKNPQFGYGNRLVKEMLFMQGYTDDEIAHYGGLRIKTSIDLSTQVIVSEELNKHLAEINQELAGEKLEGAVVVIENKTGRIVALSGGHDFNETNFNRALSLRSPGSAFKPFTYAAAIEHYGKNFDSMVCNCPFTMPAKVSFNGTVLKWWTPRNFVEKNMVPYGYIPLPTGIIRSVNIATLNLAKEIGIKTVIRTAHDMGVWGNRGIGRDSENQVWFKSPYADENSPGLQPYLPTAIGGSDVSLLELTNAFSVFARNGAYIKPSIIIQIKNSDGKILYSAEKYQEKRVLSESTSHKMTVLLRAVTKIGTGKTALKTLKQPVAVKTGTSNGPNDLLMIGYTPEYTVGVRLGYDAPKPIEIPEYMKKVSGSRNLQVSGGWVAGPLFKNIVERMYEKRSVAEFPPEIESDLENLVIKHRRAPAPIQPFDFAQNKPAAQTQKSN